jgi:DNA-binding LytR/AlgR family response regulator
MNCIIIDDDKLSSRVIEEFVNKTENLELLQTFSNAVDAINYLRNNTEIDLIFLDIEMPEMSGIDFMQSLSNSAPQIIIVSSKDKYALSAFEFDVTDYLLKPVQYSRFFKSIDKAIVRYSKGRVDSKGDEIFIKHNSSLVRLKYVDVLWVEALENYVIINTFNDKFTIHFTMKAIEQKLPTNKFSRVHRSFIVNTSSINVIEDNAILIRTHDGVKSIPIGKSYKEKLMSDINVIIK